jgi:hypothetical protein
MAFNAERPSTQPSIIQSAQPSSVPSESPSSQPSSMPSESPSSMSSESPSSQPSSSMVRMLWSRCIVELVARYISVLTLFHCISSTALGSTQLRAERVALESAEQYAFGKPKLNAIFDAKRNAKFYAIRIS